MLVYNRGGKDPLQPIKGVGNIFVCDLSSELRISTSTQPICTGQKPVNSQFSAEFYDKYFKTLTPI